MKCGAANSMQLQPTGAQNNAKAWEGGAVAVSGARRLHICVFRGHCLQKSSSKLMEWPDLPSLLRLLMTPLFWYSPTRFSKKLVLPLQLQRKTRESVLAASGSRLGKTARPTRQDDMRRPTGPANPDWRFTRGGAGNST